MVALAMTPADIQRITREILDKPYGFAAVGATRGLPEPDRIASLLGMKKPRGPHAKPIALTR